MYITHLTNAKETDSQRELPAPVGTVRGRCSLPSDAKGRENQFKFTWIEDKCVGRRQRVGEALCCVRFTGDGVVSPHEKRIKRG
jgi:hypothetical protein